VVLCFQEAQKREWNLYLNSVAELRRRKAAEEVELEKILRQERNKIEAERTERLAGLEEARLKLRNVSWLETVNITPTFPRRVLSKLAYLILSKLSLKCGCFAMKQVSTAFESDVECFRVKRD
jgi:hypothetical protein